MKMIRIMILLIPVFIGIGALLLLLWDGASPETREMVSSTKLTLLKTGAGMMIVLLFAGSLRARARATRPRRIKTQIVGVMVRNGMADLTVEARHSSMVDHSLDLPKGSKISTIVPNQLYRVEFAASRDSIAEAVARANGYSGKVGR